MKSKKLFKVKQKLIKVLVTVICVITVFFSMPMKSNASILQSIASFILIIPDGVNMLLNSFISDETENVDFTFRVSLAGTGSSVWEPDSNDSGTLYNIEITPYDIFVAGTLTDYGKSKDEIDKMNANISDKADEVKDALENGSAADAVNASKDAQESMKQIDTLKTGTFTTKSMTKMPLLDANFFRKTTNDENNSADILRPIVANVYSNLRNFVLIIMLIILLYIGIRIVVSSAVSEQVKYKQYLVNWVVGICLIFLMQYIMSAIMNFNQIIIEAISTKTSSEEYAIGFGPIDNEEAAFFNNISGLAGNFWVRLSLNVLSPLVQVGAAVVGYASNEIFDDGWSQKINEAKKDVGKANFISRKLLIFDESTTNDNVTWKFNKTNHTINDPVSEITKKPTKLNAAVYGESFLGKADNKLRAIYYCNIAEYCRTITTFSSKFTHVYSRNKSYTMSNKNSETDDEDTKEENDASSAAFWGFTFLYVLITIETVVFLYKYLKRVMWLAFLTMISPLIAVMYAVDKIGDSKAQTFNMWFKEYLFNTLIQPLHLLLYTIFIGAGTELMSSNVIYGVVAYAFMIPAEKFFKKMFGFDKASTPGGLGSPAAGMMAMRGLDRLGGFGPHGKGGKGGKGGNDSASLAKKIPLAKDKLSVPTSNPKALPGSGKNSTLNSIKGGNKTGILGGNGKNGSVKSGNIPYSRGSINRANRSSSGLGSALSSRIAGRITGGKTYNLGHALKGDKKAILKTGGKFLGRQVGRVGGLAAGTLVGAGVGLVSGALASALTGEDKFADSVQKGILVGGASGFNRGGQAADSINNFAEELGDESRRYKASDNPVLAARIKTEDFEREHQAEFSGLSANEYQDKMDFLNEYFQYADGDSIKDMDQLDRMQEYSTDSNGNIDTTRLAESIENEKAKSVYGDLRVNKNAEQLLHHNKKAVNTDGVELTKEEKDKISGDMWKQNRRKYEENLEKRKATIEAINKKCEDEYNRANERYKSEKLNAALTKDEEGRKKYEKYLKKKKPSLEAIKKKYKDEYEKANNQYKYAKNKSTTVTDEQLQTAYADALEKKKSEYSEKVAREKTEKQINYFS